MLKEEKVEEVEEVEEEEVQELVFQSRLSPHHLLMKMTPITMRTNLLVMADILDSQRR